MGQAYQASFVQAGGSIDYTPGSAVAAGAVVVQNSLIGIAKTPIAAGALGALAVQGIFDVVKVTGALNAGAALYWDADGDPQGGVAGSGAVTTTPTDNVFMGFALAAAADTDELVRLLLVPITSVSNTIVQDLSHVIADPGAGGAIPVSESGHVSLESLGSTTRTLAAPTSAGQVLALTLKSMNDVTVTCATGVNQDGDTTLLFDAPGQTIVLVGVDVDTNKRWRTLSNDGVTVAAGGG